MKLKIHDVSTRILIYIYIELINKLTRYVFSLIESKKHHTFSIIEFKSFKFGSY